MSKIEWTEVTWNPTTGCSKISQGCKFCYAETLSKRLKAMGLEKYKDEFEVKTHPSELDTPYKWKSSKIVFVNSMSDLFHEHIPDEFIKQVFKVMNENNQHVFQVLTKRTNRLAQLSRHLVWSNNIWMGVSVEDEKVVHRIESLRKTKANIKFLSLEPLIGPLPNLNLDGIDWVIVGGESGRTPRPIKKEWVEQIQRSCLIQEVAFFFKQWGGTNKKRAGRLLNGVEYNEMPITA